LDPRIPEKQYFRIGEVAEIAAAFADNREDLADAVDTMATLDAAQARALFPDLVAADPHLSSEAQAEETMRETLQSLMDIRTEYGLQRVCSA